MNNVLTRIMKNTAPQFNKDVTEGVADDILRTLPDYLDIIFRSAIKSLSSNVDLQYVGYRRLSPKEEYDKLFSKKEIAVKYDLAGSDLYMLEMRYIYMGEPLYRYLLMPFADRGNLISIGGTMYHILPVLSDTVISPNFKEVFVRLLKDKLSFKEVTKNFIVNGVKKPGSIINSKILRVNEKQLVDKIGKPLISTSLYLLGSLGIKGTFKKYLGTEDVIVTFDDTTKYEENYNIYESTKTKPRGLLEYVYSGHDVKICVPKSIENTTLSENIIFGIIYTLDILPEHADDVVDVCNQTKVYMEENNLTVDNINSYIKEDQRKFIKDSMNYVEDPRVAMYNAVLAEELEYWRTLLGRVSYKNSYSVNRITADMEEHFNTLNGYIDNLIKEKLKESNIAVDDFFDLVAYIMGNYNRLVLNSREYNSDINNRYIDSRYYLMFDIIAGFNKVLLNLNKRASKKEGTAQRAITTKEIIKIFNNELSTRKIFGLVKSTAVNLAIANCD